MWKLEKDVICRWNRRTLRTLLRNLTYFGLGGMMDNNYCLEYGLKFCCESDAILVMPLNLRDNYIKHSSIVSVVCSFLKPEGWAPIRWDFVRAARWPCPIKLKWAKNQTNEQLNNRKPNPKPVTVIQLLFNSCTTLLNLRAGTPLCPVDPCPDPLGSTFVHRNISPPTSLYVERLHIKIGSVST